MTGETRWQPSHEETQPKSCVIDSEGLEQVKLQGNAVYDIPWRKWRQLGNNLSGRRDTYKTLVDWQTGGQRNHLQKKEKKKWELKAVHRYSSIHCCCLSMLTKAYAVFGISFEEWNEKLLQLRWSTSRNTETKNHAAIWKYSRWCNPLTAMITINHRYTWLLQAQDVIEYYDSIWHRNVIYFPFIYICKYIASCAQLVHGSRQILKETKSGKMPAMIDWLNNWHSSCYLRLASLLTWRALTEYTWEEMKTWWPQWIIQCFDDDSCWSCYCSMQQLLGRTVRKVMNTHLGCRLALRS